MTIFVFYAKKYVRNILYDNKGIFSRSWYRSYNVYKIFKFKRIGHAKATIPLKKGGNKIAND